MGDTGKPCHNAISGIEDTQKCTTLGSVSEGQ